MDLNFKYFRGFTNVVELDIRTVQVRGNVRRLRDTWSPELAQDVSAFHNIDAEAELTALLSEQIAAEVDREIVQTLVNRFRRFRPIAMNLVDIQPMELPNGMLYHMNMIMNTKNIIGKFKYFRGII